MPHKKPKSGWSGAIARIHNSKEASEAIANAKKKGRSKSYITFLEGVKNYYEKRNK